MATPIPILLEVGSPANAAEGLALDPAFGTELVVEDSVIEEEFAAGSDLMLVELFAVAVFTALLKSVVVVAELVKKLPGVAVVNPLGVSVRFILSVPPAICSTKTELGLVDGQTDMIGVAEGTSEGSSVPQVLQLPEPGPAVLH